ncbi:hypothetical protein ADU59_03030 [Pararhizobium polonicum]|uniref:Uncharacterized protein n=2 Tax=Pararhizobium polonicum TaxID=1612624 RepID=A0A1C7P7G8_9HYPH|nr:hypothetical protein ADU59_03030 [Pararhizobium polonicum]
MAKSITLFVDDEELLKRLNLPARLGASLQFLEEKEGFPKPEADFGNKRYYPAVVAWLDAEFGLADRRPYFAKDDIESYKLYPSKKKKRKSRWGE